MVIAYQFTTTILTSAASAAQAEPLLGRPDGVWTEPFMLPLDPEFVRQRTGLACLNEDGYPPDTADSENARFLFDHTCAVETPQTASCHLTPPLPTESCVEALRRRVGLVDAALRFRRLPWDDRLAARVRTDAPQDPAHPDLAVVAEGLANHRIAYKYIPPDSCTIVEGCVKAPGWRRVLQFDASVQNLGGQPLALGAPDADSPLLERNVFEFSACHGHFHFSYYGDFTLGPRSVGDKRAFCLESTQRYANNEFSPLSHPFSCDFQGIAAGWGDDYIAGTQCQWIDITEEVIPPGGVTLPLRFEVNPDRFLCEGDPVTNAAGDLLFERTEFVTETGAPVDRPRCTFIPGWDRNNTQAIPVRVPATGSFVTAPCTRAQSGPLRNCGFTAQPPALACTPGAAVTLSCRVDRGTPAQVLRVCERSAALGVGVACPYEEAMATAVVTAEPTAVPFTCPGARDAAEPGGHVALYVGALSHQEAAQQVACRVQ